MMTVNNNNNNENNATSVKLTFDGQMRRFPFHGTSFAALKEQVVGLLGLEKTADIRLQYTDEEGDLITISSDLELKSAMVGGQLLRVVATLATGAAPAAPAESAPEETAFPQGGDAFRAFPCGRGGMGGFGQRGGMGGWGQRGGMGGWGQRGGMSGGRGGMGGWGQRGGMSGGRGGMAGGWDKDSKKEYKKQHKEEYEAHKEVHKALKEAHKEAHKEHRKMWKDLPKEERKMWKQQMKHAGPPHFGGPAGPHSFPPGPPPPFGGPAEPHGFPPGPHYEQFGGGPMGPHGGPFGGPRHGPWGGHHHHHHAHFGGDMGPLARGEGCDQKIIARFVKDVTIPDGTELAAGTPFVKTWRLRNEGTDAWPAGVVLCFVGKHSDDLGGPETIPAVDGAVAPGQDVDVSVALVAPTKPGRYTGYWRMCTAEGRKFGQRVWVSIVVPGNSSSSEGEKAADTYEALVDVVLANEQLRSFGVKRHRVFRLLSRFGGDTEKVTAVLTEKVNKKLGKRDRADFMKM